MILAASAHKAKIVKRPRSHRRNGSHTKHVLLETPCQFTWHMAEAVVHHNCISYNLYVQATFEQQQKTLHRAKPSTLDHQMSSYGLLFELFGNDVGVWLQ